MHYHIVSVGPLRKVWGESTYLGNISGSTHIDPHVAPLVLKVAHITTVHTTLDPPPFRTALKNDLTIK